jgi:signal transduction histidine kinase
MSSVATVPSESAGGRAAAGRISDERLWRLAALAGLTLTAAYALLPLGLAMRDLILYTLAELGAIAAIVVGIRRHGPAAPSAWLLIAAGLAAFTAGDVLWVIYELVGRDPFPSPADVFYLSGYPLLAAGLVVGIRLRTPATDVRILLDAAIVTVSASLLVWVYLVEPYRSSAAGLDGYVAAAYPIADLLLFAVAVRFVMGGSWNVLALRLLVLGIGLTFAGDVLFAYDTLVRGTEETLAADTLLLLGIVTIGLAGLHPSMVALTEEAPVAPADPSMRRLVLFAGVALIPPTVIVVQALRGEALYVPASVAAMVVLTVLIVARFADVTAASKRAAEREALLSRYAQTLLGPHGREQLYAEAERTALELVDDGSARLVEPGSTGHALTAPVVVRGEAVAEIVADVDPGRVHRLEDPLNTVAAQLSLALEREQLLRIEREAAERLAEQNARLRELDRMKDQFVSSVSHELRTPLTAMVGYLELVLDGEAGDLSDEQERFLEIVNRNCERLNRLVDDILFVARVDAGRLSLERTEVDLVALAATEVESNRAAAERRGVELEFGPHDEALSLWADPTRIGQMLSNLLSNAIKFTPEGGSVSVAVARRGDTAHVEISDTGVGIPEDEVGRLFERFFRASTAEVAQGTGLGLSIVKSIVEAHGGTISVESSQGSGTTFSIDLPVQAPPETPAEGAPAEVSA